MLFMKRKILAMLLAAVMVVSFAISASAANDWYNTDVPVVNPTDSISKAGVVVWQYANSGKTTVWNSAAAHTANNYLKSYDNGNGDLWTGWYKDPDGNYHYFDAKGVAVRNAWVGDYYLTDSGIMATSTWIGEYYVDASGKYNPNPSLDQWKNTKKGWQFIENGKAVTGWKQIRWIADATTSPNGVDGYNSKTTVDVTLQNGAKYWYYFNSKGYLVTNSWIDGTYFVGADGRMYTDTWVPNANGVGKWFVDYTGRYVANYRGDVGIDGENYLERGIEKKYDTFVRVDGSGNTYVVKSQWVTYQGSTYYANAAGAIAKNMWVGDYFVDAEGKLVKATAGTYLTTSGVKVDALGDFFINADGMALKNTWLKEAATGKWLYVAANYKKASDVWVDGTYYVGSNGYMLTDQWIGEYYVGHDGKYIPGV